MRTMIPCAVAGAVLLTAVLAMAGDAGRGEILAYGCTCHGTGLNGMKESAFVEKLSRFRDGKGDETMVEQAAHLTDEDIADLAAFFSSR